MTMVLHKPWVGAFNKSVTACAKIFFFNIINKDKTEVIAFGAQKKELLKVSADQNIIYFFTPTHPYQVLSLCKFNSWFTWILKLNVCFENGYG